MTRLFIGMSTLLILLSGMVIQAEEVKKDILETAGAAGQFKTLATALKEADLVGTLQGKGPFTLLAPTDTAFTKIPEAKLKAVLTDKALLTKLLKAHVIEGKVLAADVRELDGKKLNGFLIETKNGVKIGAAGIIKADIECSNGVIHVIDSVLMPE